MSEPLHTDGRSGCIFGASRAKLRAMSGYPGMACVRGRRRSGRGREGRLIHRGLESPLRDGPTGLVSPICMGHQRSCPLSPLTARRPRTASSRSELRQTHPFALIARWSLLRPHAFVVCSGVLEARNLPTSRVPTLASATECLKITQHELARSLAETSPQDMRGSARISDWHQRGTSKNGQVRCPNEAAIERATRQVRAVTIRVSQDGVAGKPPGRGCV